MAPLLPIAKALPVTHEAQSREEVPYGGWFSPITSHRSALGWCSRNDGRILALVSREAWLAGPAQAPVAGLQPRGGWRSRWHRSSSRSDPGRGRAPPARPRTTRTAGPIRSPSSCRLRTRLLGGGSVRAWIDVRLSSRSCSGRFVANWGSATIDLETEHSPMSTHPKAVKLPAGRQPTPGRLFRAPQSVS